LTKGGILATVVGDGQIEHVRIPIGMMTVELGADTGLKLVKKSFHILITKQAKHKIKNERSSMLLSFKNIKPLQWNDVWQ